MCCASNNEKEQKPVVANLTSHQMAMQSISCPCIQDLMGMLTGDGMTDTILLPNNWSKFLWCGKPKTNMSFQHSHLQYLIGSGNQRCYRNSWDHQSGVSMIAVLSLDTSADPEPMSTLGREEPWQQEFIQAPAFFCQTCLYLDLCLKWAHFGRKEGSYSSQG